MKSYIEPKPDTKPLILQKNHLWPLKYLETPEFLFPVKDEALKVKKIIEKMPKQEEEKLDVSVQDPKKGGKNSKDTAKKDTKKDSKKDTKKAGKKGNDVVEKKVVPLLDWPVQAREKVLVEEGNQLLNYQPNYLLAVKVEVLIDN